MPHCYAENYSATTRTIRPSASYNTSSTYLEPDRYIGPRFFSLLIVFNWILIEILRNYHMLLLPLTIWVMFIFFHSYL